MKEHLKNLKCYMSFWPNWNVFNFFILPKDMWTFSIYFTNIFSNKTKSLLKFSHWQGAAQTVIHTFPYCSVFHKMAHLATISHDQQTTASVPGYLLLKANRSALYQASLIPAQLHINYAGNNYMLMMFAGIWTALNQWNTAMNRGSPLQTKCTTGSSYLKNK